MAFWRALLLISLGALLQGCGPQPEGQTDDQDVHHALFLLRRAQGLGAPSFDDVRAALKTHRDQVRDVAA